jgi:multiple sugar transport system permease protein
MATRQAHEPLYSRVTYWLVIALSLAWLIPLFWVLGLSFKPNEELSYGLGTVFRWPYTVENYSDLLRSSQLGTWIVNSLIVSVIQTALVLVICSVAGYGFARLEFPGRRALFIFVLLGLAIPGQAIIIPLHSMFADLGLLNTYPGLILPHLGTPFGVFLMASYFRALPKELEEAAALDNASRWKIFLTIALPLSVPAQITLAIFTFLNAWNDYLWPLIAATRPEMYTLTIGLAATQTNFDQSEGIGYLMAQAVFAGLPMLILYLIFQKYVLRAVAGAGGR